MRWLRLFLVAVATATLWLLLPDLPAPARIWATLMLAPVPALLAGQDGQLGPGDRIRRLPVYASTAIFLWIIAIVTLVITSASRFSDVEIGLLSLDAAPLLLLALATTAIAILMLFGARWLNVPESTIVHQLIPATLAERWAFAGLSLTAGFCEEVVFRGFLLHALGTSWGVAPAVVVTSAIFGWMHAYQNAGGAVRAGLLGLLLCGPTLATGSILPAILAHAAVDLLAGLVFARRLIPDLA
jgi:CAAX protease family protein